MQELKDLIKKYNDSGEIIKSEYATLKSKVDRAIEKSFVAQVANDYMYGKAKEYQELNNDDVDNMSWMHVYNANDVLSLKNKLAKIKSDIGLNHPLYHALKKFYDENNTLAQSIKDLKDKIVTVTQKKQEVKTHAAVVLNQAKQDSSVLIKLLNEHRAEFIKRNTDYAQKSIDTRLENLKKNLWDLSAIAPKPDHKTQNKKQYENAIKTRGLYTLITSPKETYNYDLRKENKELEANYIKAVYDSAEASYDSFIHKLMDKIGKPVVKATMTGNPWTGSVLTVETNDGETQIWKNKMIVNFSKYDKPFNQFPSNKVK